MSSLRAENFVFSLCIFKVSGFIDAQMACLLTELFLKSFSKALTCQNHFPEALFSEAFKINTCKNYLWYVSSVFFDFESLQLVEFALSLCQEGDSCSQ